MADLTTYSGLQAAVLRWLRRTSDTFVEDDVPALITLAEVRFNRDLRVRQMETVGTLSVSAETASVPTGWLETRTMVIDGYQPLTYRTPQQLWTDFPTTTNGQPVSYTVVGSTFYFRPIPATATSIRHIYYASIAALSDSNTSNWLLSAYPDVYLYGTLLEAAPYLKNDARIETWAGLYQRAIGEVSAKDQAARWGGGPITMRIDAVV